MTPAGVAEFIRHGHEVMIYSSGYPKRLMNWDWNVT